jgi:hypothetical protein
MEGHANEPEDEGDEHEDAPTITAVLKAPVTVDPGQTVASEWTVTVDGPLRPGARYRATAPLYTTDITFVVTPSQEPTSPPSTPSRARGTETGARKPRRTSAAGS